RPTCGGPGEYDGEGFMLKRAADAVKDCGLAHDRGKRPAPASAVLRTALAMRHDLEVTPADTPGGALVSRGSQETRLLCRGRTWACLQRVVIRCTTAPRRGRHLVACCTRDHRDVMRASTLAAPRTPR